MFDGPDAIVGDVPSATNGLGDGEFGVPVPLGLRPRFNDPRGRPRLDDGTYCWSKLVLERTEVKYAPGVVIRAGSKSEVRRTCAHQQRQINLGYHG